MSDIEEEAGRYVHEDQDLDQHDAPAAALAVLSVACWLAGEAPPARRSPKVNVERRDLVGPLRKGIKLSRPQGLLV
ncbi:hypothetical protein RR46_05326 [Papilio xuthus]|uniref:Uncharacterized protein n=1 Tax=Papilio xuthus TaxID=66420 RepID=A0A194QCA2_PAPXU|nr:hypothetical protein RR46_05326 [Papilio xuthus]